MKLSNIIKSKEFNTTLMMLIVIFTLRTHATESCALFFDLQIKPEAPLFKTEMNHEVSLPVYNKLMKQWKRASTSPPYVKTEYKKVTTYHLVHPEARKDVPLVSKSAKAVILAFGGSGTAGANGALFMRNASSLAKYEIDLLSIDYPFHASGSRNVRLRNAEFFLKQIEAIILKLSTTSLPIFLLGHSFGSVVIQELLYRKNTQFEGAFMLSPGGNSDPFMLKHYQRFRFSDKWKRFLTKNAIQMDSKAEEWAEGRDGAGGVSGQFKSNQKNALATTKIPSYIISGSNDLWSSPHLLYELSGRIESTKRVVFEGSSHQSVLSDKQGKEARITNFVVEKISAITGISLSKTNSKYSPIQKINSYLQHSQLFAVWFKKQNYSAEGMTVEAAKLVLGKFNDYLNNEFGIEYAVEKIKTYHWLFEKAFAPKNISVLLGKRDLTMKINLINDSNPNLRQSSRQFSAEEARKLWDIYQKVLQIISLSSEALTQQHQSLLHKFNQMQIRHSVQNYKIGLSVDYYYIYSKGWLN